MVYISRKRDGRRPDDTCANEESQLLLPTMSDDSITPKDTVSPTFSEHNEIPEHVEMGICMQANLMGLTGRLFLA